AKEQLKGGFVLGLESGVARMNRNGKTLLLNGKVLTVDEVISRINSVTRDDIERSIKRMFDLKNISASAVGKVEENGSLYNAIKNLK
ncbi:MAG: insulinase family protein, partial [Clostridia bacterium]|nr:insulinase family protein [Clostridia bacterium]